MTPSPGSSRGNNEEKKRTRRDTATVTSRTVEVVQRRFMAPPPFPRSLPLVTVCALLRSAKTMRELDTIIPIEKIIRTAHDFLLECDWKLEINESLVCLPENLELVVQTRAYIEANAPDIFIGSHFEAIVFLGRSIVGNNWLPIHGYLKLYFDLEGNYISEDRFAP